MKLLLITYDLKKPGQNYQGLYETIKTAPSWWHHLESTWLIFTLDNPQTWTDRLIPYLDANDRLLILEIPPGTAGTAYQGWLSKKAWDWINDIMSKIKR